RVGRQRAVDDRVVDGSEIWRVEQIAQRPVASWYTCCDVNVASIGKVNRDRFVRLADLDRHTMVLHEKPDLLSEIPAKKIRPRHRRLIHPGAGDEAIREARVEAGVSARGDPDKWIGGTDARVERLAANIRLKSGTQEADITFVDFGETGHRRGRIGEGFGGDPLRRQDVVSHRRDLVGCRYIYASRAQAVETATTEASSPDERCEILLGRGEI